MLKFPTSTSPIHTNGRQEDLLHTSIPQRVWDTDPNAPFQKCLESDYTPSHEAYMSGRAPDFYFDPQALFTDVATRFALFEAIRRLYFPLSTHESFDDFDGFNPSVSENPHMAAILFALRQYVLHDDSPSNLFSLMQTKVSIALADGTSYYDLPQSELTFNPHIDGIAPLQNTVPISWALAQTVNNLKGQKLSKIWNRVDSSMALLATQAREIDLALFFYYLDFDFINVSTDATQIELRNNITKKLGERLTKTVTAHLQKLITHQGSLPSGLLEFDGKSIRDILNSLGITSTPTLTEAEQYLLITLTLQNPIMASALAAQSRGIQTTTPSRNFLKRNSAILSAASTVITDPRLLLTTRFNIITKGGGNTSVVTTPGNKLIYCQEIRHCSSCALLGFCLQ